MDDLPVIVDPADRAETDRHQQRHPHEAVREIAPQQRGHRDRHQDQRAAHRRRARLHEVRLRPVVAHGLADLHPRQPDDDLRADDERDQERRHAAQHGAQREVAEDVERADVLRQELGQPQEHQCAPSPPDGPHSAATTRSMRMKREPLTRIVVPAAAVAATMRRERFHRREMLRARRRTPPRFPPPASPTVSSRSMPALARALADFAMEGRAVRADFAHVAQHQPARRRRRGEHVDRGEHRIRVRVVGVVDHGSAGRRLSQRASRPATGRNASRPRTIAASGTPIGERRRGGRERIRRAVPSGRGEPHRRLALRGRERDRPSASRSPTRRRDGRRRAASSAKSSTRTPSRSRAAARQTSAWASSALSTTVPPGGSARTIAACSAATSATLRMNS